MKTRKVFFLCRNGNELYKGLTYMDCIRWLHATSPESQNCDLKHEGYSIKETEEQLVF